MENDFKFFDNSYDRALISANGVIQLLGGFSKKSDVLNLVHDFPIVNHSLIAPFWTNMNDAVFKEIRFCHLNDLIKFNDLSNKIDELYPFYAEFKINWIYSISWDQVNLFLVTKEIFSFLIFDYTSFKSSISNSAFIAGLNNIDGKIFSLISKSNIRNLHFNPDDNNSSIWIYKVNSN